MQQHQPLTTHEAPKISHQTETGLNKEISDSGANGRRPDISLQVPPRPLGFGSTAGGKVLDHSQSFSKGWSSPKGFLRVLSFKRKVNVAADGERSSLLNSDPKTAAESTSMTSISEIPWSRCNSLPVSHAPNLSPSVAATPVSARTYNEQQIKPHKDVKSKVSRSLSIPGRNVVIVRSVSFNTRSEQDKEDTNDDQITPAPVKLLKMKKFLKRQRCAGYVLMSAMKEIPLKWNAIVKVT
uniref:Uncharacterized protein n=1 Tax=Medicago truncatula TaxID=3880 RepID=I3SPN0_MEDTR|nr:unknown [Medicago truncatula]